MKKIGIWIDKEKANIVIFNNGEEQFLTINSDIEYFNVTANKTLGGAMEVVRDRKFLEREKHQIKSYFKAIVAEIKDANEVVIFGPAQMPDKFKKELDENHHRISVKIKAVEKADSMTDNQVIAWVKEFFGLN